MWLQEEKINYRLGFLVKLIYAEIIDIQPTSQQLVDVLKAFDLVLEDKKFYLIKRYYDSLTSLLKDRVWLSRSISDIFAILNRLKQVLLFIYIYLLYFLM